MKNKTRETAIEKLFEELLTFIPPPHTKLCYELRSKYKRLQKEQMIQFAQDALIKYDFGTDGLNLQFRQQYKNDKRNKTNGL